MMDSWNDTIEKDTIETQIVITIIKSKNHIEFFKIFKFISLKFNERQSNEIVLFEMAGNLNDNQLLDYWQKSSIDFRKVLQ